MGVPDGRKQAQGRPEDLILTERESGELIIPLTAANARRPPK